jgi:cytochrome b561
MSFSAANRVDHQRRRDQRAASSRRLQSLMHFRFYLMMFALFLIGLEAIYSLYQLVTLVL